MYVLEVIAGKHYEGARKLTAGERFETSKPLHKRFRNKFMLIEVTDKTAKETEAPRPRKRDDYLFVRHMHGRGKFKIYRLPKEIVNDITQAEVPEVGHAVSDFLTKREAIDWLKGEKQEDIATVKSDDPIYAEEKEDDLVEPDEDVEDEDQDTDDEEQDDEEEEEQEDPKPEPKTPPKRRSRKKK